MRGGLWWVPLLLFSSFSLLSSPAYCDVVLTDQEATELDEILKTLETRSIEQQQELSAVRKALEEAKASLAAARTSSEERETELRRATLERDRWMISTVIAAGVGLLGIAVVALLR